MTEPRDHLDLDAADDDLTPPPQNLAQRIEGRRATDDLSLADRMWRLEWRFRELRAKHETTQAIVEGLKSTMESKLQAFAGGQVQILEQLKALQALANKADGAWSLMKVLGAVALATGTFAIFVGIVQMITRGKTP